MIRRDNFENFASWFSLNQGRETGPADLVVQRAVSPSQRAWLASRRPKAIMIEPVTLWLF
jgi:hypothetical protein